MRSFFLLMVVIFTMDALAQERASMESEKTVVAVLPFDAVALTDKTGKKVSIKFAKNSVTKEKTPPSIFEDKSAIEAFAEAATQKIVNAFVKMKRVRVVERSAINSLIQEQDFQMTDFANPQSGVQIGEMTGAEYIVQGQLQQVTAFEKEQIWDKKKKFLGFSGSVELNLRIIDVSTGQITESKDIKGSTEAASLFGINVLDLVQDSPSKAAYAALNEAEDKAYEWLKRAFPIEGFIFEIKKEKKGKAKQVYITCGKDLGVRKGDKFKVIEVTKTEVNGKIVNRTKDIGKLEVTKLEEDGVFSKCDVLKGGKQIFKRMENGEQLKIISVKK